MTSSATASPSSKKAFRSRDAVLHAVQPDESKYLIPEKYLVGCFELVASSICPAWISKGLQEAPEDVARMAVLTDMAFLQQFAQAPLDGLDLEGLRDLPQVARDLLEKSDA